MDFLTETHVIIIVLSFISIINSNSVRTNSKFNIKTDFASKTIHNKAKQNHVFLLTSIFQFIFLNACICLSETECYKVVDMNICRYIIIFILLYTGSQKHSYVDF